MPRFERRDVNNPPVHAAWWDEGEEVVLRPRKSFAMVMRAQTKGLTASQTQIQDMMSKVGAGADRDSIVTTMAMQNIDAVAMHISLLLDMIVSWTFRYPPTDDQRERGEPGDLVPVTAETLEELDERDGAFLVEEIDKRGGGATQTMPPGAAEVTFPDRVPIEGEALAPSDAADTTSAG